MLNNQALSVAVYGIIYCHKPNNPRKRKETENMKNLKYGNGHCLKNPSMRGVSWRHLLSPDS